MLVPKPRQAVTFLATIETDVGATPRPRHLLSRCYDFRAAFISVPAGRPFPDRLPDLGGGRFSLSADASCDATSSPPVSRRNYPQKRCFPVCLRLMCRQNGEKKHHE